MIDKNGSYSRSIGRDWILENFKPCFRLHFAKEDNGENNNMQVGLEICPFGDTATDILRMMTKTSEIRVGITEENEHPLEWYEVHNETPKEYVISPHYLIIQTIYFIRELSRGYFGTTEDDICSYTAKLLENSINGFSDGYDPRLADSILKKANANFTKLYRMKHGFDKVHKKFEQALDIMIRVYNDHEYSEKFKDAVSEETT